MLEILRYRSLEYYIYDFSVLIRPLKVKPLENYILEIEFSNGEIRKFDCTSYLNGDWYSELLELVKFNSVRISGNTVEWSSGQDLCPDCLYDNSF